MDGWHLAHFSKRWWPRRKKSAAMSRRKIYDGLPLPAFLMPKALSGTVLEVDGVSRACGIRAVNNASLKVRRREIHALIGPERRRQDHAVQFGLGAFSRPTRAPSSLADARSGRAS